MADVPVHIIFLRLKTSFFLRNFIYFFANFLPILFNLIMNNLANTTQLGPRQQTFMAHTKRRASKKGFKLTFDGIFKFWIFLVLIRMMNQVPNRAHGAPIIGTGIT